MRDFIFDGGQSISRSGDHVISPPSVVALGPLNDGIRTTKVLYGTLGTLAILMCFKYMYM